jgi:hypothetical protein
MVAEGHEGPCRLDRQRQLRPAERPDVQVPAARGDRPGWDAATTSSGIIAKLKADPPLPCVFKIDASTNYASGNFDLSDVETSVEVPGATMIKFTANVKSNGIFVLS